MTLEEVTAIRDLLLENDFKELKPSEDMEIISENYLTTKEIARKLDVKLDAKTTSEALTAFGYKQYMEGTSVPTNPENSAFMIKAIENEDTEEKEYYIQNIWLKEIIEELNECMNQSEEFKKQKQDVIKRNKKIKNEKLRYFSRNSGFVAISLKKTGFSLKKDFIVSIGFAIVENNKIIKTGEILIDDEIDEEKVDRYLKIDEIYEKSPYNFLKIKLPTMEDCTYKDKFIKRRDALKLVYKLIKNKDVIWHNADMHAPFLQKLFEKEGNIPSRHCYYEIINEEGCIREAFEWLEPKESDKLFNLANRHGIQRREKGALADALLIANISLYLRNEIKGFKDRKTN
jgi:hypothetical protein